MTAKSLPLATLNPVFAENFHQPQDSGLPFDPYLKQGVDVHLFSHEMGLFPTLGLLFLPAGQNVKLISD